VLKIKNKILGRFWAIGKQHKWHDYPCPWHDLLYNLQLDDVTCVDRKFAVRFRPIRKDIVSSMLLAIDLVDHKMTQPQSMAILLYKSTFPQPSQGNKVNRMFQKFGL